MTVVHGPEPVARVLRDMASDVDVCVELVHAARSRSPELSRLTEEATRSHVTAMLRAADPWFTAPERTGSVDDQDFTAALLLGADRAVQGVPMTVVLRGCRRRWAARRRSSWTGAVRRGSRTGRCCRSSCGSRSTARRWNDR